MITIVRISKKSGPFYQVDLSNEEELLVSEDLMVRYRLLKGQELSEEQLQAIKEEGHYDYGLQRAMNYLSYQLRTEKEIKDYLRDAELSLKDIGKVIQQLKHLKLIDDQGYGDSYVRTQMRLTDKGPQNLKQQLKKKGLSEEVMLNSLTIYDETIQLENAMKALTKGEKRLRGRSIREKQQKLKLQLMQKGFGQELIQQAMAAFQLEVDEEEEAAGLRRQADKLWVRHHRLPMNKRMMKVKQSLYQKGFALDDIQYYLEELRETDEE